MADRKSSTTTRGSTANNGGSGGSQTTTRARSSSKTGEKQEKQSGKQASTEKQAKTTSARSKNAKPATVNLTFNVTVPENTAKMKKPIYVAGNFNQFNNKHPDWDTQSHKMKKVDATHYTLTLKGQQDARIEYKYTLGDWDHVEVDAHCHDIHNRHVTLHGGDKAEQTVDDIVHNWRNSSD